MNLFQIPAPTRYDLNFTISGISVRVHPLFWLLTVFLGASSNDLLFLLVWVVVVFVSILVHELGHAFVMSSFGQPSYVVLHLMGGLTVPESMRWGSGWANVSLSRRQQILISLAGPGAGFFLAMLVMAAVMIMGGSVSVNALFGIIPIPMAALPWGGKVVNLLVMMLLWINVFWGVINLMPVYPLDGGQVARHLMIIFDPMDGEHRSMWLSVIAGALVAGVGLLLLNSIYIALLFGYLAYQSYQSLQGSMGSRY